MDSDSALIVFLIVWIIGTILAGAIASNRNTNKGLVVFISLCFSPVIGCLLACLMAPKEVVKDTTGAGAVSEKKCPQCAEMVKDEAIVCRFCGYSFASEIAAKAEAMELARVAAAEAERIAEEARRVAREEGERATKKADRIAAWAVGIIVVILAIVIINSMVHGPVISPTPLTNPPAKVQ